MKAKKKPFKMDIIAYRAYCLSKPGVTESMPFGDGVLVFKVMEKIFTLAHIEPFDRISLKWAPEKGVERREQYDAVIAGYHMNKKHWNTIYLDGSISDTLFKQWIDESYQLVVASLSQKLKNALSKGV